MDILKEHPPEWVTAIEEINDDIKQGKFNRLTVRDKHGNIIFWRDPFGHDLKQEKRFWDFICNAVNSEHRRGQEFEEWWDKLKKPLVPKIVLPVIKKLCSEAWLASNNGRTELAEKIQEILDGYGYPNWGDCGIDIANLIRVERE